ncbi:hypothetical protein I4U23_030571 [Adineta vaga]|nr:hypothetical protein I4U23_030571 [Adineta vaga]
MSLRLFKLALEESLKRDPLPNEDKWILQPLRNYSLQNDYDWFEVLYRTRAWYQCKGGHTWESSWAMILFRIHLYSTKHFGIIRMKRFGQQCSKCEVADEYYVGMCAPKDVWYIIQCVLCHLFQKVYEKRATRDLDVLRYIIPISDVPKTNFHGMPHKKERCEACAADRCQEMYKELTKKASKLVIKT